MKLASVIGFGLAIGGLGATAPACSDPVAPAPDGAVSFRVTAGSHASSCVVGTSDSEIPRVNGVAQTVDARGAADKVQGSGATVDRCGNSPLCCRVAGGGTYEVQAMFAAGTDSISFSATISEGQSDATGTVSIINSSTKIAYGSPHEVPCKFSVAAKGGESYGIAAGRAWGTFHCDTISDPSTPGSACALDGTFLIENCAQ